jgi:hypothetical protein
MRIKPVEEQRAVLIQKNIKREPDNDVKITDSVDANDEDLTVVGQKVLKEWIDISELEIEQIRETQSVKNVEIRSCTDKEVRTAENQIVLGKSRRHEVSENSQVGPDETRTETNVTSRDGEGQTVRQGSDVVIEKGSSGKTNGKKFICKHCPYTTKWRGNFTTKYQQSLKLHVKRKHTEGVQLLQGDKCNSKRKYKQSAKRHAVVVDADCEEFRCEQCGFKTKSLEQHVVKKRGEVRRVTCAKCGHVGEFDASLEKQIATDCCRNRANEDKECVCEKCKFKSNIRKRFKEHFRKDSNKLFCKGKEN